MPFIGNQPALAFTSFAKQDFTTSATTSYTLDHPVTNENEIALFINFVRQEPTTAYTASGTSLTLTSATSGTDDMYCVFLGKAVQTVNPPAGSVGASQISDGSIALGKLSATGTKDATTFLRGDNTFSVPAGGSNSPYFQAYQSGSAQTIGATWTKVQINDEVVDSANAYDNSTNYRFTPQTAGKYFIYGQVTSASSTDMDRCMSGIYLNGSRVSQTNSFNGDSSSAHTATIVSLNGSSDYVELYGYFGVSTSTDLQGRACFFGGYKLID